MARASRPIRRQRPRPTSSCSLPIAQRWRPWHAEALSSPSGQLLHGHGDLGHAIDQWRTTIHHLGAARDIKLGEDAPEIGRNRPFADPQFEGDVLGGAALRHQDRNLELTSREAARNFARFVAVGTVLRRFDRGKFEAVNLEAAGLARDRAQRRLWRAYDHEHAVVDHDATNLFG